MKKEKGFTLLELMIVIAIIGLLIAVVIPDLLKTREMAEIEACKASLRGVQSSLELYYTHYKNYPENLQVLITEGYLQENGDKDNWNKSLRYVLSSSAGGAGDESDTQTNNYLLGSDGPDGKQDTDDDVEPPINTKRHTFKKGATDSSTGVTQGVQ